VLVAVLARAGLLATWAVVGGRTASQALTAAQGECAEIRQQLSPGIPCILAATSMAWSDTLCVSQCVSHHPRVEPGGSEDGDEDGERTNDQG